LALDLNVAKRIHWADMLVGQEKQGAYLSAEFFVLPSHQENFGISITEAMAFSLPVLITDKVNIWREVVEADAGICIPDTYAGVRDGLIRMCALAPETRAQIGNNARRCFAEQFDLDKNAREFLALLCALTQVPNYRPDGDDISHQSLRETSTRLKISAPATIQMGETQC
jgi:glycosyltransferase involved in cell wall biosynthesis